MTGLAAVFIINVSEKAPSMQDVQTWIMQSLAVSRAFYVPHHNL